MNDQINEFLQKPICQKVLFFNEMLTPSVIRLVYWLVLAAVIVTGLFSLFDDGFIGFIRSLIYMAVGVVLARVGAELIILSFKIHENIEKVAKNTAKSTTSVRKKASKKVSKKLS